jgi:hypothetical protein
MPLPPAGNEPLNEEAVVPVQMVCDPLTVLLVITGFTVIVPLALIKPHPPVAVTV